MLFTLFTKPLKIPLRKISIEGSLSFTVMINFFYRGALITDKNLLILFVHLPKRKFYLVPRKGYIFNNFIIRIKRNTKKIAD